MMLIKIFLVFFKVGLLSFGGGLAAISIIQDEIVIKNSWISMAEFTDLITIAQMTPGPIAINLATFVGISLEGFLGALVATIACVLPSIMIVSTLTFIYFRYRNIAIMKNILNFLRPVVIGLISFAGIIIFQMMIKDDKYVLNYIGLVVFALAIYLLRKLKFSPILSMLISGVTGLILYSALEFIFNLG